MSKHAVQTSATRAAHAVASELNSPCNAYARVGHHRVMDNKMADDSGVPMRARAQLKQFLGRYLFRKHDIANHGLPQCTGKYRWPVLLRHEYRIRPDDSARG